MKKKTIVDCSIMKKKTIVDCSIMIIVLIISLFPINVEAIDICLSAQSSIQEKEAAKQLSMYIHKITGESSRIRTANVEIIEPAIFVGVNAIAGNGGIEIKKLKPEEWYVKSIPEGLLLVGEGTAGTLYATYHYLEDVCGIRWWNAWEEFVSELDSIKLNKLNLHGVPSFRIREIYSTYGNDGGRFDSRMRINRNGYYPISPTYGDKLFGPPYSCHTFKYYIPPEQYFEKHPEWFSLLEGKRINTVFQLCLSNSELRKEMVKRLRYFIKEGEDNAKRLNIRPPFIYDISQNDNNNRYCHCTECQEIADRTGSQAGLNIDCINEIASTIKTNHPDLFINTFAYEHTEKVPETIKPADNVIITLCHTLGNAAFPINSTHNVEFYDKLKKWSAIAPNLRIWDYTTTYLESSAGLPFPSVDTYPNDLKLFSECNVKYMFCEFEKPILADARDYKIWMLSKYMENVNEPFDELSRKFANGCYGPAGALFLEYRECLRDSQNKKQAFIGMWPSSRAFTFLDCSTLQKTKKIFNDGEKILSGNQKLLSRWHFAFLSMHRAICIRRKSLMIEWYGKHQSLKDFPFNIQDSIEWIRKTWTEEAQRRLLGDQLEKSMALMNKDLIQYSLPIEIKSILPPAKFANIPADNVFYYTADDTLRWLDTVIKRADPDALSGMACCLTFPNKGGNNNRLEKYLFPVKWSIYSPTDQSYPVKGSLDSKSVSGPGYHWYNIGNSSITSSSYMTFFWSWRIKLNIDDAFDSANPETKFDIWVRMKFTGSAFLKGEPDADNAIYLDCVVLVKK